MDKRVSLWIYRVDVTRIDNVTSSTVKIVSMCSNQTLEIEIFAAVTVMSAPVLSTSITNCC